MGKNIVDSDITVELDIDRTADMVEDYSGLVVAVVKLVLSGRMVERLLILLLLLFFLSSILSYLQYRSQE